MQEFACRGSWLKAVLVRYNERMQRAALSVTERCEISPLPRLASYLQVPKGAGGVKLRLAPKGELLHVVHHARSAARRRGHPRAALSHATHRHRLLAAHSSLEGTLSRPLAAGRASSCALERGGSGALQSDLMVWLSAVQRVPLRVRVRRCDLGAVLVVCASSGRRCGAEVVRMRCHTPEMSARESREAGESQCYHIESF